MSTDGKNGMIINKLEALNKMLKNKHYGDTGPSTEQEMDLGIRPHSRFVNIELQAKMDEFAKMKMEDERNQERRATNAPAIEENSLNESLGNIEEFLNCEEPEDPDEREKRRQEGLLIEGDMKLLGVMFPSFLENFENVGDEKNVEITLPGSSSLRSMGRLEFGNNEDMKNLQPWAKYNN